MKNIFRWVQLGTTDPNAAKDFYEDLFRWKITHQKLDKHKSYLQIDAGDGPCGGIDLIRDQGRRSQWVPFISVSDIHEYERKARDLGADIILLPMDLGNNEGFISVFKDTTGATIGIHSEK